MKEKNDETSVINVYGFANIGCTIVKPTYQTLVQGASTWDDAEDVEEENVQMQESEKSGSKGGRPKRTGKKITKTFIYEAGYETSLRLQYLYKALIAFGWIKADTDQKYFMNLFSGEETTSRLVWTGGINTLTELFKELVTRKNILKLPKGESIWVMVNARFWEKEGNKEFGSERLRSTRTPIEAKEQIDLLVKMMDPSIPISELMKMIQSQR